MRDLFESSVMHNPMVGSIFPFYSRFGLIYLYVLMHKECLLEYV